MKLLLDTHIWIWAINDPSRLGQRLTQSLSAPDTELWLSPISVWEFVLLIAKKRFATQLSVREWMAMAREQLVWADAALVAEIAAEAAGLQMPHRDPSDRLILATARWYGLTLATADENLLACGRYASLLPNR